MGSSLPSLLRSRYSAAGMLTPVGTTSQRPAFRRCSSAACCMASTHNRRHSVVSSAMSHCDQPVITSNWWFTNSMLPLGPTTTSPTGM